ncbi:HigA family addiction module antitoxin [Rhodoferax sp.]|uniref:HigA family addiction module antitoxin n=1 Tax=Rhodoferax sp. TaxID=50421 RepID=UPI00374DF290
MTSLAHHTHASGRPHVASLAEFSPGWIVTPGETIADLLEERGWTQADLANRTGFTKKHINQLLHAHAPITQETAAKLEKVLGSTARFWIGLDTQYRQQLASRAELDLLAKRKDWLKELPLKDMIRFGWIRKADSVALQVKECLKYFAVSSVEAWREVYAKPVVAYRAPRQLARNGPAVSAWLRQGERMAEELRCEDFNAAAFQSALQTIRGLTRIQDPHEFVPKLAELCAKAGVAVVVAPAPKGCPVSGATKWLSPNRALILLSVRGKSDDKLWFTFFHEAGHLLKHGKSLTFLDILGEEGLQPKEEAEADAFARDYLIPAAQWHSFVEVGRFSHAAVRAFAEKVGIAEGIGVGRLQHEKHIPYTYLNALKVSYTWNHADA